MREEEKRSLNQILPCRTNHNPRSDIVQCPDRVVLFEDIIDFLFPILSDSIQKQLIFILLELLGFPIYYMQRSIDDTFTHENLLNKNDSKHLFSIFSTSLQDRFDHWKPFAYVKKPEVIHFIKNVMEQSIALYPNDNLFKMALLDFVAQSDTENAKRNAKQLLSSDRNNLILWNQYAQMERKSGNIAEARNIYEKTLQIVDSTTPVGIRFLLYRSYSELEILSGNVDRALHVLCHSICTEQSYCAFSEDNTVSGSMILKCGQLFQLAYEEILQQYESGQEAHYNHIELLMCYCLFDYVVSKGYVQGVNRIFESLLSNERIRWPSLSSSLHHVFSADARAEVYRFNRMSIESEEYRIGGTHEQCLWLLYLKFLSVIVPYCGQNQLFAKLRTSASSSSNMDHVYAKKMLKDALQRFLIRFPAHPIALSIYIENEQRAQLSSHMRRFLDHQCQRSPSPINFMFTIYAELRRGGSESENRVRSIFERALEYQACRTSVMFWRMYLYFEHSSGQLDRAKRIFYRAIDKCCYAKVLWLDAAKIFKEYFSVVEFEEIVGLMDEKELLLRAVPPT